MRFIPCQNFQHLGQRRVLMQALRMDLRMPMSAATGRLRFDWQVEAIDACQDSTLGTSVASEEILTRRAILVVVAMWAVPADAHTPQVGRNEETNYPEAVHAD